MSLDFRDTYVLLQDQGLAADMAGGAAFWKQAPEALQHCSQGWLISEHDFDRDWPSWEMHPEGDEIVRLVQGAVDLHLEYPDGIRVIQLRDQAAVIVPRGIWHTARVPVPSRTLHISRGQGTQHRAG